MIFLRTNVLARLFYKGNLADICPILCSEALLKFAISCTVSAAGFEIARGVGTCQYGAGMRGGASRKVAEARAAANVFPDKALVSIDVKNAF